MSAPINLPATKPLGDWTSWSNLPSFIQSLGYRTARVITDSNFPYTGSLPSHLKTSYGTNAGSLTQANMVTGNYPAGAYNLSTAATSGDSAAIKLWDATANSGAGGALNITANKFGLLALTLRGLSFSKNNSTDFDFQMGFPGVTSTVGGCALWHLAAQPAAEVWTYAATGGTRSKTPRRVSDATVANTGAGGAAVVTSATAAFVAADVGQPMVPIGNGGAIQPPSLIASVDSATQVTLTRAPLSTGTNQSLSIGQSTGVGPTQAFQSDYSLTFLWDTIAQYAWIMCDDQVLGELNLNTVPNYSYNSPVVCQWQVINRGSTAVTMSWRQSEIILAHN